MLIRRSIFLYLFILNAFLQNSSAQTETEHQYSLYLPKSYVESKSYPLLIFLDPAARGSYPVNLYKEVANDLEIILAGSLDSRNADPQTSIESINAILNDLLEKYDIDKDRIWLSGFSGGARVAAFYAVSDERIKGIIACGAGFAGDEFINGTHAVSFAGIVGYQDMNFEEIIDIGGKLTDKNKKNLVLFFDGGHEWPPPKEMGIAVQWLLKEKSKEFKNSMVENLVHIADSISNEGMNYLSWLQLKEYEKISGLKEKITIAKNKIEVQKIFNKNRKSFQSAMNDERQFMDEFTFLFTQTIFSDIKDVVNEHTWKDKIRKVRDMKKSKDKYQQLSADRLLDFSWRLCSEQYYYLMELKQFVQAYKAAKILSFLEIRQINTAVMISEARREMSND